jgi:peptide methionine sulfoxide reductase MsrA
MGAHTETLEVVYDPATISYEALMDVFLKAHAPTSPPFSRQYRSAVFVHDEAQRAIAEEKLAAYGKMRGKEVFTAVEEAPTFWPAEDYHQKYRLRGDPELMAVFRRVYGDDADFLASTAAARVNGYLAGFGEGEDLEALGLPKRLVTRLRERLAPRP